MNTPLLLLHGALASKSQFDGLLPLLQSPSKRALDFPGHGSFALKQERNFSIEDFARSVIADMDHQGIAKADVFGYSMGGYVSIYLCINYPDRFNKIITLATKYHWSPEVAAVEKGKLNPAILSEKAPAWVEHLKNLHIATPWEKLLAYTAAFMNQLGELNYLEPAQLGNVQQQVLLALGDRDKMVTLEETLTAYKAFPKAQLAILPGTPHALEKMDVQMLANHINRFLAD